MDIRALFDGLKSPDRSRWRDVWADLRVRYGNSSKDPAPGLESISRKSVLAPGDGARRFRSEAEWGGESSFRILSFRRRIDESGTYKVNTLIFF